MRFMMSMKDLWRPEVAGKISMVYPPREVIGANLKYMGASYSTKDFCLASYWWKECCLAESAVTSKAGSGIRRGTLSKGFWSLEMCGLPLDETAIFFLHVSNVAMVVPK